MKKKIWALLLITLGFGIYWYFFRDKPGSASVPDKPLTIETNTAGFSGDFEKLINHYYLLRDAFIKSDAGAADSAASNLKLQAATFSIKELKADTVIISTAESYLASIATESTALINQKTLEEKRRSFQVISDGLYDLVRTVKYDKTQVYLLHCPMAFNHSGANWLSNRNEILNPYFGNVMLNCGEVSDSNNYVK